VAALAVETADPDSSAARAQALLAPRLPRRRGPAEADLAAVEAPDGTSVFFCDGEGWLDDFVPLDAAEAPAQLERIDHVALDHPLDAYDEAVLFYRSVLGLEPRDGREHAGPDGLIRSRPMTRGEVRLALSVPVLPGTPGVQHVAFACPDVLGAARAMAERGAPALPVPHNYYDDLAARTELAAGLLDDMRALGVRHDGERLHCRLPTIGERVFLELVEPSAA